jgi:peptidoglycan hydrolase CwlO-like protein
MDIEPYLPILVALVGSAGLWGFLSTKAKNEHERRMKEESKSAEFNDTLKEQVESLNTKVDKLVVEKEELLKAIADLRAELAEARATVQHLENMIRMR